MYCIVQITMRGFIQIGVEIFYPPSGVSSSPVGAPLPRPRLLWGVLIGWVEADHLPLLLATSSLAVCVMSSSHVCGICAGVAP